MITDREIEKFWEKVEKTDYCWNWKAYIAPHGYAKFVVKGLKTQLAHRISYIITVGPIPEGMSLDHLCRNRSCVNPEHLEPVSNKENVLRGVGHTAQNARRTHCKRGHELSGENVWVYKTEKKEERHCRDCRRERHRNWKRKKAALSRLQEPTS